MSGSESPSESDFDSCEEHFDVKHKQNKRSLQLSLNVKTASGPKLQKRTVFNRSQPLNLALNWLTPIPC